MSAEQQPYLEPVYLVNALESAWDRHQIDQLLPIFAPDATITLIPGVDVSSRSADEERYEGSEGIATFLALYVPGASTRTSDLTIDGERATWTFEQTSDRYRELGIGGVAGRAEAQIRAGTIRELRITFGPETIGRIRAARATAEP